MKYIQIKGIERKASRVALGTWAIGGWMWGGSDEKSAIATIQSALDLGINVIDTAPAYGFGRAEEIVGKALAGGRRASTIIATKVGLEWRDGQVFRNSEPVRLRGARKPSQLQPLNAVFGWILDDEAKRTIDRILADTVTHPVGPEFMAPPEKHAA